MGVERQSVRRGGGLRRHSVLAWLRMWRVVQKVERAATEHLRAYGLNYAQFDVLAHVGAAEGSRQKELGESLHVTKGNVSHLIDQMERRGLVSRRQEGRTNRLYLTEEGRRLFEEVVPVHEDLVHQQMSALRGGASAAPRAAARSGPLPLAAASTMPTASCPISSCASRMSNGAGDSGGQ
jgi:DNA-binding MarR family transcriptional regulator